PMSHKDIPTFEILMVKMCVSNGLPFSFVENKETQAVFNFIAPGLKLSNRKKLGGKILLRTSENFQDNILKIAQSDENVLTATFKESAVFRRVSQEAVRIVSYFHNSTFFTGNL